MASYLIPYVDPRKIEGHEDPVLEEFTYGDVEMRGKILRENVKKGIIYFSIQAERGNVLLPHIM